MNKWHPFCAAAALFLVVFLLFGCSQAPQAQQQLLGSDNPYSRAVLASQPNCQLSRDVFAANRFAAVQRGNLIACLDVEVLPGLSDWRSVSFLPQTLTTVVLVIDHEKTAQRPAGWLALLDAGLPVSYPTSGDYGIVLRRAAFASIAYGLEGKNYTKEAALSYLRQLDRRGGLIPDGADCPVMICFDTQAMVLAAADPSLEIIVPEEGTLSFACGLLGQGELVGASDANLLAHGLRLLDGRCQHPCAPTQADYASAVRVPDFQNFADQTQDFIRDFRRDVQHIRYFSSADGRENILFTALLLLLIIAWTATALHRSTRRDMRRWIWYITGQTISWLLLSVFKYMLFSASALNRFCWYSYYIFLLGLPLTSLYIALSADQLPNSRKLPPWYLVLASAYPLLLGFVMTNDLHQLVFRFDPAGNWSEHYEYGPVYYLIFAHAVLCFLLSLLLLISKSRKTPRHHAWVGPVLVALTLIAFNVGYILGIPLIRETNLTLIFCTLSILFMESVLHAGLIPSNTKYKQFFSSSPLNIQLIDRNGETVLAASGARELTQLQRLRLTADPETPFEKDENTLLHCRRIHGGLAVWQEDIGPLNALQKKLHLSIEQCTAANDLLLKKQQILHQKVAGEVSDRLFQDLEADIDDKVRELSSAVRTLPQGPGRERGIAYITLLLCHIKRRCNLFFLSQEGQTMSSHELAVYVDELSEFASYAGIHALARSGLSGPVGVGTVTLCYDFYFSVLSWAVLDSRATLLGQIEEKEGCISFSLLSSEPLQTLTLSDAFRSRAENAGAVLTCRTVEDTEGIYLTFPLEEGEAR